MANIHNVNETKSNGKALQIPITYTVLTAP